jgi:hypothetical protein
MAIPDLTSGALPDPRRLQSVLAYKSPRRFFAEVSTFAAYFYARNLPDWPRLFRMYHVLMTLEISASIGVLGGFFDEHEARVGAHAHEAAEFLREIKATRTADLLAAAIELFPAGRVPTDHRKRERLTERIREGETDPFEEINRRHKGAIAAMYAPFQRYMRAHARELLADLESVAAVKKPRKWRPLHAALRAKTPAGRLAGGAPKQHAALYAVWERVNERIRTHGFEHASRVVNACCMWSGSS